MTLTYLLDLARCGAALGFDSIIKCIEFRNIEDFAKTWQDLADANLEDLDLRKRAEL